jgi:hypothetical protein
VVVPRWRFIAGDDETLKEIVSGTFDPRQEAIVAPQPGGPEKQPDEAAEADGGEVRSFVDRTHSLSMDVFSKGRSLLVLSDTWYPGWTATVDGVRQPVFRVNYLFRGVFLEPGVHRVEFVYEPTGFQTGVGLFLVAAAGCCWLGWLARGAASVPVPDARPI